MCPTELSPQFLARTPAKAILAGEHFVLHGAAALAVPVPNLQLTMRVSMRTSTSFALPEPYTHLSEQVSTILEHRLSGNARIWVTSEIPVGAGLGSSAAFSVALGRCLVLAAKADPDQMALGPLPDHHDESCARAIAHLIEGALHGTSSGIDTATVAEQKPVLLRPTSSGDPKVVCAPVRQPIQFCLLDSGIRRKTKEQIAKVSSLKATNQVHFDAKIDRGVRATELATDSLGTGDLDGLGRAIHELGEILQSLELEPQNVTALRDEAEAKGISLKITGAGGGGFFIAYHPDQDALASWSETLPPEYRPLLVDVPATAHQAVQDRPNTSVHT